MDTNIESNLEDFVQATIDYSVRYNKKFHKFYTELYNEEDVFSKAKLHAVYSYIIKARKTFRSKKIKLNQLHEELVESNIGLHTSYHYFISTLNKMQLPGNSIESFLKHESKGKTRESRFSIELIEKAEVLYAENPLWKYPRILSEVNIYASLIGLPSISLDHIKRYFRQRHVQERLRCVRNGEDYFLSKIGHQNHLKVPFNSGKQLEIDGTRHQIPYYDQHKKEIGFLVLFCILDVTSRKILGYSVGKSENSALVVEAFKRFLNQFDFAPIQITRDNSSAYKRDFIFIENYLASKGVEWVASSNPRSSSHISSFQRIFAQSICTSVEAYIGQGIRTKDIDSRLSAKQLKKRITDKKRNLPDKKELILQIDKLIVEYNRTSFSGKKSAEDVFNERFKKEEVIPLSVADKAILIGPRKTLTVKNSEIQVRVNSESYFYKLSYELASRHDKLIVAYLSKNMNSIYVFDLKRNFLQEIELDESIPSLKNERSDSQQQKFLKTISQRRKQFKIITDDVKSKKQRSIDRLDKIIPLYDYQADKTKEEQIKIQNSYSREYLRLNEEEIEEELNFPENDPIFSGDMNKIKNKI